MKRSPVPSRSLVGRLRKIVGSEHVRTAEEELICYSYDASQQPTFRPDVVVHPGSAAEISEILALASENGIPVVPRGAGTGLSGGSLAVKGGIVLAFGRMNRVIAIDAGDRTAEVEPGVTNHDLRSAAESRALMYPPDPSSTRVCTLGGNVAENAGGPHSLKYGVTADYVMALEFVLASGEIASAGSGAPRNVTGYNLPHLLTGSEGTLAVISRIVVRLVPQPRARQAGLVSFRNLDAAGEAIAGVHGDLLGPAALELMDATAMELSGSRPAGRNANSSCYLLLEFDGEPEDVRGQIERSLRVCRKSGGTLVQTSASQEVLEQIWQMRQAISGSLGKLGRNKIGEDVSVPRSKVPQMIARIKAIEERHRLAIAIFGHAGDGNLHPNIIFDASDPQDLQKAERAIADLFEAALEMGGTLSGEHGIGIGKSSFMASAVDSQSLALMKGIKSTFDPKGILNPGKIFD